MTVRSPTNGEARPYTARTRTVGGRERGVARSCDGRLDVKLSVPGGPGVGTNPEELYAAGWSASFASTVGARRAGGGSRSGGISPSTPRSISTQQTADTLRARFLVSIPGVDAATGEALLREAEALCPLCKAARGNVDVAIDLEAP